MREFEIRIRSVQDILTFVDLSTSRPFPVLVGNEHHQVNGKSFMEMFCLNFTHPLFVCVSCSEEDLRQLKEDMHKFLA